MCRDPGVVSEDICVSLPVRKDLEEEEGNWNIVERIPS